MNEIKLLDLGPATAAGLVAVLRASQTHSALRDLAEERSLSVSGLSAIRIDTWDRLSHQGRRAELFVLLGGRLLCLQMGLGRFDVQDPAFEALTQSLRFESVDALL